MLFYALPFSYRVFLDLSHREICYFTRNSGSVIILGDLTFAIKVYLCVMQRKQVDYKSVLSLFLPQGILDYFDIVDYSDMGSYYLISLEERKVIPLEHSHMKLVSKGFFPETVITDFPARDRTVYLKIRRRRWEDPLTGKTYSRNWDLVAEGTRITKEFGAFLKELH